MFIEVILFIFSIFDAGALLFLSIYSLITLSDLECDHINAKECCLKLNRWVIPEHIAYLFLIILFSITKHWILSLIHLPMAFYMIYLLKSYAHDSTYYYDPVLIQNNSYLKKHIKSSMIKIINHLIFFFIYLYNLIITINLYI